MLKKFQLKTPLGPMLAVADEKALYVLEFVDCHHLERELEQLCIKTKSRMSSGKTAPIVSIEKELQAYFKGELKKFKTPLQFVGSPFQKSVWAELLRIPYGETRSYAEQAAAIGKKSAYRAVANANSANSMPIVIPCHRIINSNGELGGYGGGLERKRWLLAHEKKVKTSLKN